MKINPFIVAAVAAIIAIVAATQMFSPTPRTSTPHEPQTAPATPPPVTTITEPTLHPIVTASATAAKPTDAPPASDAANQSLVINGYTVTDPGARLSLQFVGTDADADAYWQAAINDPNLPAEERKDLIEDLNQDGLENPQLATPNDLILIESRIELIDRLAPDAMDQVNVDAFAEARKDLINLYEGQPAD